MQVFQFDLSEKTVTQILNVKQGDVGRKFRAVITAGGTAYSIPAGTVFSVWYSGPGGMGNYSGIGTRSAFAVQENTVTVELIAQMLANAGTGAMCLVMNGADGSQLGLWNMVYVVDPVPGMGSAEAEQYYTALSEVAAQAIKAAETFKTDTTLTLAGRAADAAATGTALAGKAPSGYGLGGGSRNIDSVLNITANGWYITNGDTPDGSWYLCHASITNNGNDVAVTAWNLDGTKWYKITKRSGTWGGWKSMVDAIGALGFTKVWENTNPISSFAAQTITIDLSTAKAVLIVYRLAANNTRYNAVVIPINFSTRIIGFNNFKIQYRDANIMESGITFEDAMDFATYGLAGSVANTYIIPRSIYTL